MELKRLTGSKAGSLKYDLLTALNVAGLHGTAGFQTSMSRLTALITARYNWKRDELTVGQRDMARLWGVNERTVKREIKKLTATSILICKRSGVRGRVGAYRLNYTEIYRQTRAVWHHVGPDFEERMDATAPTSTSDVVKVDFSRSAEPHVLNIASPAWRHVLQRLRSSSGSLYSNWFSQLQLRSFDGTDLRLSAPNRFIARYVESHLLRELSVAAEEEFGPIQRIYIEF